ncbi:hypothetical protein, partial [Sphingobacterium cavernae]|uniref:hypothetical protein n=1 Tax=Sphingobacterium cavernae TaxID=2592657 RepID=UPI001CB85582
DFPLDFRKLVVRGGLFSSFEGGRELFLLFFLGPFSKRISSRRPPMVSLSCLIVAFRSEMICSEAAFSANLDVSDAIRLLIPVRAIQLIS